MSITGIIYDLRHLAIEAAKNPYAEPPKTHEWNPVRRKGGVEWHIGLPEGRFANVWRIHLEADGEVLDAWVWDASMPSPPTKLCIRIGFAGSRRGAMAAAVDAMGDADGR